MLKPKQKSFIEVDDIQKQNATNEVIEDPVDLEPERGFFCSELIIKAFKYCGLANIRESSKTFLPSDLSSKASNQRIHLKAGYLEEDKCVLVE